MAFVDIDLGESTSITGSETADDQSLTDITTCLTDDSIAASCYEVKYDSMGPNWNSIRIEIAIPPGDVDTDATMQIRIGVESVMAAGKLTIAPYSDANTIDDSNAVISAEMAAGGNFDVDLTSDLIGDCADLGDKFALRIYSTTAEAAKIKVGEIDYDLTESGGSETVIAGNPDALAITENTPLRIVNHIAAPRTHVLHIVKFRGLGLFGITPTITVTGAASETVPMGNPDALVLSPETPTRFAEDTILAGAVDALAITEETPERSTLINAGAVDSLAITEETPERSTLINAGAVDALILGGDAPTLAHAAIRAPALDELVLSETTATVSILISVPVGSMTITGLVPLALGKLKEEPATVALVISEETPVRLLNHIRGPPLDAVAFGENLTPTLFSNAIRSPALDPLVISGEQAIISRFADPELDELNFGSDAPLALVSIVAKPPLDELVISPETPERSTLINAGAVDALVISPETPTRFVEETVIAGAVDALAISEETPTAQVDDSVFVPRIDLHLVTFRGLELRGITPTVVLSGESVSPGLGSLTLSETTPVLAPLVVADSLVLNGLQPTVIQAQISLPALDALILGSTASDPIVTTPESPSVGSLTLTGLQPAILKGARPAAVGLTITGLLPEIEIEIDFGVQIVNPDASTSEASNYEQCDFSGFRQLPGSLKMTWNRHGVRKKSWDERHPATMQQSGHTDRNKGPQKPEQNDRFIDPDNPITPDDL